MTVKTLQEYLEVQPEPSFEGLKQFNRKVDSNDLDKNVEALCRKAKQIQFKMGCNLDQSLKILELAIKGGEK